MPEKTKPRTGRGFGNLAEWTGHSSRCPTSLSAQTLTRPGTRLSGSKEGSNPDILTNWPKTDHDTAKGQISCMPSERTKESNCDLLGSTSIRSTEITLKGGEAKRCLANIRHRAPSSLLDP